MEWDQRDINFLQIYTWFQVFDYLHILGNTRDMTCETSTRGKLSRRVIQNNKIDNAPRAYKAATESRLEGQGGTGRVMLTSPGTMHKFSAYNSPLLSLNSRRECSMLVAQKDKIKARLFPGVEREVGPHSWNLGPGVGASCPIHWPVNATEKDANALLWSGGFTQWSFKMQT